MANRRDTQHDAPGERPIGDEHAWLKRLDASIASSGTAHSPPQPIVLPPPHPASLTPEVLLAQCNRSKGRSGGPGGQHRNKVETLVHIEHLPTAISAHAGERRSVTENQREAVWRLRLALAVRVRCAVPAGDVRSILWKSRCSAAGRLVVSPEHNDYPALLAEAIDTLWAASMDSSAASARLGCTVSQLHKLIKDHPPAWVWLNTNRSARGMPTLK